MEEFMLMLACVFVSGMIAGQLITWGTMILLSEERKKR